MLFLDEPTTGLDPQSRLELWEQVTTFRASGGSVLLTTHYMEEAQRLCDRIAIVDHGKLIALGTPSELIASLEAPNIVEFATEKELEAEALKRLRGVQSVRRHGANWILAVDSLAASVPLILSDIERSGAKLQTLTTHQATLEDVFVSLTGRELRDE